jgi:putative ABC transport system permease protein
MELWAILRQKLTALTKKRQLDRDLDEEAAFHLAMRERKLRDQGLSSGDAHDAALRAFGNRVLIRETTREVWLFAWLEHLGQDLRYAARSLRKSPVLAVVVILSLALGIGANTAIFSLMDAVMFRFLPVQDPQQLVKLQMQAPSRTVPPGDYSFTNAIWEAVRDEQSVFSGVFASSEAQQIDMASGGAAQYIEGVFVSGAYFSTLGIRPAAGRLISIGDDHRGCPPVAVLSYGFWQSHFRGAESAAGTMVSLRGHPFQIIGVTAPGFYGVEVGKTFDVAMPLCASAPFDKRNLDSRGRWWLQVIGRIQPGLSLDRVQSGLALISPRVMSATMPDNADAAFQKRFMSTKLITAPAGTGISELRGTFRDPLRALMAIVVLVLIIACANIASLLLARMTVRDKEMAIRKALGASRGRLMRQLITESMLLSVLGAALGLLFARWGGAILVQSLSTGHNPVFLDLSLDRTVLGFSLAIALLTGVVMGMLPALDSTRVDLTEATKTRTAGDGSRARYKTGRWIVAGQVALSLVLLVGSALLLRTFVKLMSADLGFDPNHVLIASIRPPWWAADDIKGTPEQRAIADQELERRLRGLPGVVSASRSFTEPLGDDNWVDDIVTDLSSARSKDIYFNFVTPEYFATLRTSILAGRNFNNGDTRNSQPVAIINQTLARDSFAGVNPLGHRIEKFVNNKPPIWIEIVGVMNDAKYERVWEKAKPTVFLPATQPFDGATVEQYEMRTAVTPESLIPAVQRAVAELDPRLTVEFHTMAEHVGDSVVQQRLVAELAGFFGALALVLAMIGLYGVLSYAVTQRQVEFGIRMALGAQPHSILRLVMRDVALVLATGLGAGIVISFAAMTVLQKLLFGLQPRDPATMIGSVCLLGAAALLAGYIPARRATRVDPMVALRYE